MFGRVLNTPLPLESPTPILSLLRSWTANLSSPLWRQNDRTFWDKMLIRTKKWSLRVMNRLNSDFTFRLWEQKRSFFRECSLYQRSFSRECPLFKRSFFREWALRRMFACANSAHDWLTAKILFDWLSEESVWLTS